MKRTNFDDYRSLMDNVELPKHVKDCVTHAVAQASEAPGQERQPPAISRTSRHGPKQGIADLGRESPLPVPAQPSLQQLSYSPAVQSPCLARHPPETR